MVTGGGTAFDQGADYGFIDSDIARPRPGRTHAARESNALRMRTTSRVGNAETNSVRAVLTRTLWSTTAAVWVYSQQAPFQFEVRFLAQMLNFTCFF